MGEIIHQFDIMYIIERRRSITRRTENRWNRFASVLDWQSGHVTRSLKRSIYSKELLSIRLDTVKIRFRIIYIRRSQERMLL